MNLPFLSRVLVGPSLKLLWFRMHACGAFNYFRVLSELRYSSSLKSCFHNIDT